MRILQDLVPPAVGRVRFSWPKALWLWGHGAATLVLLPGALDASLAGWALLLKAFEGLSPDQVDARAAGFALVL